MEYTGQKSGVGAYTVKSSVRITYIHMNDRIIKKWGVGAYTEMGAYSDTTVCMHVVDSRT